MTHLKTLAIALSLGTLIATVDSRADDEAAAAQKIEFTAKPGGLMKFEQTEVKAKAGVPIELTFKNPDILQHNLLVLRPGTKDKVGALADAMLTDPDAMQKGFVPESADILHATKLLNAGQNETLKFTLAEPGDYPIICTFPGHWRLMFANLKVEK